MEPSNIGNTSIPSGSFLSERAKMEKERLERQKRLRPETITESERQFDTSEDEENPEPPAKRHHHSTSNSSQINPPGPSKEPLFWDGELRQTATIRAEPRKDGLPTFRLTDILGKVS
jgi:tyrosyl-DNA phosphodiesterase-1